MNRTNARIIVDSKIYKCRKMMASTSRIDLFLHEWDYQKLSSRPLNFLGLIYCLVCVDYQNYNGISSTQGINEVRKFW